MTQAKLRCQISPGQFSSECAVVVKSFNGRSYSLFASKSDLRFTETPTEESSVEGWINVDVLEQDNVHCLIHLPQSTLENGPFLTVRIDQLDRVPVAKQLAS